MEKTQHSINSKAIIVNITNSAIALTALHQADKQSGFITRHVGISLYIHQAKDMKATGQG